MNLVGREANGLVETIDYDRTLDEVEAPLRECLDPRTGGTVVDEIDRVSARTGRRPVDLGPTESDLIVIWTGASAFAHPTLGRMGPVPIRRAGGHRGRGDLVLAGPGIEPGSGPEAAAFDIAPTICALVGEAPPALSGRPLYHQDGSRAD